MAFEGYTTIEDDSEIGEQGQPTPVVDFQSFLNQQKAVEQIPKLTAGATEIVSNPVKPEVEEEKDPKIIDARGNFAKANLKARFLPSTTKTNAIEIDNKSPEVSAILKIDKYREAYENNESHYEREINPGMIGAKIPVVVRGGRLGWIQIQREFEQPKIPPEIAEKYIIIGEEGRQLTLNSDVRDITENDRKKIADLRTSINNWHSSANTISNGKMVVLFNHPDWEDIRKETFYYSNGVISMTYTASEWGGTIEIFNLAGLVKGESGILRVPIDKRPMDENYRKFQERLQERRERRKRG